MLDHILVVVSRFLCTCGGRDCWQCWFIVFWFRLGFFIVCFFHCLAKSQPKNYQSLPRGEAFATHFGAKEGKKFKLCTYCRYTQRFVNSHTCICYYICKKTCLLHTQYFSRFDPRNVIWPEGVQLTI